MTSKDLLSCYSVVVDGPTLLRKVKDLALDTGLKIQYSVQKDTNLFIGSKREGVPLTSTKVKKAKLYHIPFVDYDYIEDCINNKQILPLDNYMIDENNKNISEENNINKEEKAENLSIKEHIINNSTMNINSKTKQKSLGNFKKNINEGWREAKVFISSTFRDMHGERDYLTKFIFPELQDRCDKIKVHVNVIDLRWGVTEEEAKNGDALQLCLDLVDECRPFFVGLLGTRYGWIPDTYSVPSDNTKYDWLSHKSGYSVTHLEMEYGALHSKALENSYPLIYIRDSSFLSDVPSEYVGDFLPESYDAEKKLKKLKNNLKKAGKIQLENYSCNWEGIIDGKPMTGGLEILGSHILESLWKLIQDTFPCEIDNFSPLQAIINDHDHFIESHSRLFIGRHDLLRLLNNYASLSTYELSPKVVVGLPGSGKTSLVSAFAKQIKQTIKSSSNSDFVISHFIGGAPGSTSIRLTLLRIVQELWNLWNIGSIDQVPQSYPDLEAEFLKLIERNNDNIAVPSPVLIIIDALNQFDDSHTPWTLQWLPEKLKKGVRVIVSTLKGKYYDSLSCLNLENHIVVPPLTKEESKEIIVERLSLNSKKLNNNQMKILLNKQGSSSPLYLTIVCEELRVFGIFEKLDDKIKNLPESVPLLFVEVLKRLEKDFGSILVRSCLSIIASVRNGISGNELKNILGGWSNPLVRSLKEIKPLEEKKWKQLERGLREYLSVSGDNKEPKIGFFHEQLLIAVRKAYLSVNTNNKDIDIIKEGYDAMPLWKKTHYKLAEYFQLICDINEDKTWIGNKRGLSELPYHATKAKNWKHAIDICSDLGFMEAKMTAGFTFDLLQDYILLLSYENEILQNLSLDLDECKQYMQRTKQFHRFLKARTYILHRRPQLTFPVALSLPETSYPCKAAQSRWNAGLESRPHIRWNNKPAHPDACIMTLSGHTMVVRYCCVCPDPNKPLIASVSHDLSIRIWDADTGELLGCMFGHTRSIDQCAFSRDGKKLVSCSWDKTVRIWDLQTFQQINCYTGHTTVVHSCDFNPNGKSVISGDRKGMLFEHYSDNYSFKSLHKKEINDCCFSCNGKYIATASSDKTVGLWDSETKQALITFTNHSRPVLGCRFSPDDSLLGSCGEDKKIILYDVEKRNYLNEYTGHADGVVSICFNPKKFELLSCSHDNMLIVWDLIENKMKSWFLGHTGSVFSCEYFPEGDKFVSSSFDRSVKVWEISDDYTIDPDGHTGRILGLAISKDGKKIATASRDKTAKIWNFHDESKPKGVLVTMSGHLSNIFDCAYSPDSRSLITASRDSNVRIWDANTGECLKEIQNHTGSVWSCAYSPDGSMFATAGEDKLVHLWDPSGERLGTLYGHRDAVLCVAFSPDSQKIISASKDKTLKLWHAKKRRKLATYCGHTNTVSTCNFSPDSKKVLSGGEDNIVIEWSALNAKRLGTIKGHDAAIKGCCYSADGRRIITASTDSMVVMWDSISKREICSFASLSRITSLQSSNLGSAFAVGDGSGTLYYLQPVGDNILESNQENNK